LAFIACFCFLILAFTPESDRYPHFHLLSGLVSRFDILTGTTSDLVFYVDLPIDVLKRDRLLMFFNTL